ncbi:PREDICTED: uncharacterized protein LOC106789124 [Polistes canadensis]|uniref:uncharacterized protein LOC106789124 n=1 Tax=Polistes canadensis TaxID=91411 RepID=UPI000718E375|nr:PREDICTED: uncharacterized protein LOC106789124 [Polistes canadensis]KAI4480889.1 hypothetical protein M0804_009986 [Polistes exclamans]
MDSELTCEYQNAYNIQVLKYDKLVQRSLNRVAVVNGLLKSKLLTIETRERLEGEMREIQRILMINKQQLDRLRRKDRGLFSTTIFLFLFCFLTYVSYYIFTIDFSKVFAYAM